MEKEGWRVQVCEGVSVVHSPVLADSTVISKNIAAVPGLINNGKR